MKKAIVFLIACLFSLGASAQDLKLSFGGSTLTGKEKNFTTIAQLQKDSRLVAETPGYKVISYVISFLPSKDDMVGPCTIKKEQDFSKEIKMFLDRGIASKIFLDDIKVQGPDGKVRSSTPYLVVCK